MSGGASTSTNTSGNGTSGDNGGEKEREKEKETVWYFTSEQLVNSPSRRQGIDIDVELSYRQVTAYLIQEMGQRLQVSQLCINTAIVYMHRFYAFHSFTHFHRNGIAAASLFLAAKVEEQPRKLEHVIKAANKCLNQQTSATTDAYYLEQAQDLVFNENVLLQTLGFDVAIDHPHTHVVKTCHLVKACKDLAQTSYFLASNSLHLTSMCLQYRPTVVACFCIYLACKWSRWEIPQSTEGKHWFQYVDKSVTMDLLKQLTDEFITIYEKSPDRLKSKLNSIKALAQGASTRVVSKDKKAPQEEWKMVDMMKMYHSSINTNENSCGSNSSNNYPNDQMTSQSVPQQQAPLLPQQQQAQQQQRKSEMHSSQHRAHHNTSSKLSFHSSDIPDHKGSQKQQQQSYSGGHLSRSRDHSQNSQGHQSMGSTVTSTGNGSRSSLSSSSRSNSVSGGNTMAERPPPHQRATATSHPTVIDVSTYHKTRQERANQMAAPSAHGVQAHLGHKLSSSSASSHKQDSGRSLSKESSGGRSLSDHQSKQGSTNKMYISSASSTPMGIPLYPGSQISSGQLKDHDTRNMLRYNTGGIGPAVVPPPLNYHHQQNQSQLSRSTGGGKHDQSKSLHSVHHMQSSSHHKQQHQQQSALALDNAYGGAGGHDVSGQSHQQSHQQHQHQQSSGGGQSHTYSNTRLSDGGEHMFAENHSASSMFTHSHVQALAQQAKAYAAATSSLFSPEWMDVRPVNGHHNNNNGGGGPVDAYSGSHKRSSSGRDSPKRAEREREGVQRDRERERDREHRERHRERDRNSEQTQSGKKERSRSSHSSSENARSGHHQKTSSSSSTKVHAESSSQQTHNQSEQTSSSTSASGAMKRSSNDHYGGHKQEELEVTRDNKIRKLDNAAGLGAVSGGLPYSGDAKSGDISKIHGVVNGIETNPDLVRNLLKEGLCSSALLKQVPSLGTGELPDDLLEPAATTSYKQQLLGGCVGQQQPHALDTAGKSDKGDKKKKKDKHKHKEKEKEKEKDKEKTKERDEKKKHKKDKERHREREPEPPVTEHVKIKITKEKLETAGSNEPMIGFKIKIPKERIGDIGGHSSHISHTHSHSSSHSSSMHSSSSVGPTPALKIKILKDRSVASGGSTDKTGSSLALPSAQSSTSYYSQFSSGHAHVVNTSSHNNTSSGSNSSKKKDRDRDKDRDREKKRSSGSSGHGHHSSTKSHGPSKF